ncbi:MAG: TRAM domain-containing protein, partial [Candidatus Cloacimonadaceae bacterium]|nr:TRAM domain-containing protein [Candidatus Cloacimonadaceae bacterium]
HLPLQSGDNEIRSQMNRNYTIEHYHGLVTKLRKAMPDIAITTDLIAGFPNESDAQFEHTMTAMRDIGFDYAFCFKFSPREGTKASTMQDQVEESVRLARLQDMIILQRQITLDKFSAMIGREVEVYVEGLSKKSAAQISGKTEDYKIAVITGTENQIGTLVRAKVIAATAGTLICS